MQIEFGEKSTKTRGLTFYMYIPAYNPVHFHDPTYFEHYHTLVHLAWPYSVSKLACEMFPSNCC